MTLWGKSILLLIGAALFVGCADPELTAPVPNLPDYEEPDGSLKFRAPPIPDWVGTRTIQPYEITLQNRPTIYAEALEDYKNKDFDTAYPKFLAVGEHGLKVAYVYLGLIEMQAGDWYYPRGGLTRHYEALDSGAHASSLIAVARGLKDEKFIEADRIGAAQYYLRVQKVLPETNALYSEAQTYLNTLSRAENAEVRERELMALTSGEGPSNPVELVKAVIEVTGSHKAPGTEYLADYPM